MKNHGLRGIREQTAVQRQVVVGVASATHQRAACHQDRSPAFRFDAPELLAIGGLDVIQSDPRSRGQLIGTDPAGEVSARDRSSVAQTALDQLACYGPIHAHATLCGIHRLSDLKSERPQVFAKCQCSLPIDHR